MEKIQSKVRNSVCILCILKVVKSLTVAESQTSIAEQVGVNQSTISRFANKDEAQVLIEKEQLKLVEVLPDTVQNVKDLVEEMKDIPKGDIKRRELSYKASTDVLKATNVFPNPNIIRTLLYHKPHLTSNIPVGPDV
jgi:predicted XRE-type DNA-binding protein